MSLSLISFQMIRVISSPSISTTGLVTLIFAIELRSRCSAVGLRQSAAIAAFSVALGRIAADALAESGR